MRCACLGHCHPSRAPSAVPEPVHPNTGFEVLVAGNQPSGRRPMHLPCSHFPPPSRQTSWSTAGDIRRYRASRITTRIEISSTHFQDFMIPPSISRSQALKTLRRTCYPAKSLWHRFGLISPGLICSLARPSWSARRMGHRYRG